MKVIEHIKKSKGKPILSFEVLPPIKGKNIELLFALLDKLMHFSPSFINVTYHQVKQEKQRLENGNFLTYASRKRPGTVGVASAILNRYRIDPVPHIICRGFSPRQCEDILLDFHYLGINNVLALLGDDPIENYAPSNQEHPHASKLVRQISDMNSGKYFEKQLKSPQPLDFCVGVAGYPEKHFRAATMQDDVLYLKKKNR